MAKQRTESSNKRQYDAWAGIYDHSFGALVKKRQRRAIAELEAKPGDRVLDLGVGTGLTLQHYPDGVHVIGLDLSPGMLTEAADRVDDLGLDHVSLIRGDAMHTPFADDSFDHVLVTHVISVVSDPVRLLDEAARLVKPGGHVVVLNHFRSSQPIIGAIESMVNPLCMRIGWRSDLRDDCVVEHPRFRLKRKFQLSRIDLWQILVLTAGANPGPAPDDAPDPAAEGSAIISPG